MRSSLQPRDDEETKNMRPKTLGHQLLNRDES